MDKALSMGVTLLKQTICCKNLMANRKITPRILKLHVDNQEYMVGLSNLKVWDNPPLAPPKKIISR